MPDARFLIVGTSLKCEEGVASEDHDYQSALEGLVDSLGINEKIIFTGHRDDAPDVLAAADISVLPSHSEGLSNTILESMSAGLPVIATDVGGNPELVKEGINGTLVPAKSPRDLAGAMERLLIHPEVRRELGERGRDLAKTHYSLTGMISQTRRLYREQLQVANRSVAWL